MGRASQFLNGLAAQGRHHFTTGEARASLGVSLPAARAVLRRMKGRGEIADPHQGFYVIVSPEYRRLGCLPAEQFIPQLMEHLGEPYYVALLSAAEFLGAAHQRPQVFQVMVRKNRRPIRCGDVRVEFVARKDLERMPTITRNTPRGTVRISSPEATALELVGYADRCGGLDNVATVVADLVDVIDASKLVEVARLCPLVWTQRLGYLLDLTGHADVADALVGHVQAHAKLAAPLIRRQPRAHARRDDRWKLAVNASVEPDF
jgi:predicted transcriptional regulator of viral defense system